MNESIDSLPKKKVGRGDNSTNTSLTVIGSEEAPKGVGRSQGFRMKVRLVLALQGPLLKRMH